MRKNKISHNVILRLPRYLRHLEDLQKREIVRISSGELGQQMGVTASQIRQDLSCFGEFGQQGYGYNVEMLISEISEILGAKEERRAIVIGAGNLGRAIIGKFPFMQYGFRLTGAFDLSPQVIGEDLNGVAVFPLNELEEHISVHKPHVAILTMSSDAANTIATRLVDAGVKGFWNFANVDLSIGGSDIVVENLHFSDSLLTLSYYMTHGKDN